MIVRPGNAQHIGDRADQQDSFGFSDFNDRQLVAHGGCLMVLADGMGGLADGAAASRLGVARFLTAYGAKPPGESIGDALSRGLAAAQHAVAGWSPVQGGSGSTLVAAVVHGDRLYWISLGDSRLYLCRNSGPAMTLTTDHNLRTLLTKQVERGELDPEMLAQSGNLEALTDYLGAPHGLSPDLGSEGVQLLPGDTVMACSDGLYRGLSPEQIGLILDGCDAMTGAERLVEAVLRMRMPHQDNVTVVTLQLTEEPATARPATAFKLGLPRGLLLGLLGGWLSLAAIVAGLLLFHVVAFAPRHRAQPVFPEPAAPRATPPTARQLAAHHPPPRSLADPAGQP